MTFLGKILRKRDKYIIIYDILSQCENGALKIWLLHRTRLSYELLNKFVTEMMDKGLIWEDDGKYYLTEKGEELLETLEEYRRKRKELYKIISRIEEIYNED